MTKQIDSTKSMGRTMAVMAWLCFFVLAGWFFNDYLSDKQQPNRGLNLSDSQQLELVRNRAGHYIAPGEINGVAVQFLLDTGATYLSIPQHIADQAGLRQGKASVVSTANGRIRVYRTIADEVRLGGLQRRQVEAFINPAEQGGVVLLGMSFLKYFQWRQIDDRLILTPQN
ncbi:retroviral-like aspartic protease family protein [Neiella marina]|uniref:Retroviral-like aspartic protease family protein n=1 Tax=Neiella holothuriorum TaxID=2870530 RepID=A0ABS7EFA3_9GAMM|nr:retropepsin-like aspartic protease [Neiella holothuriorum]MBW8190466.1 retroviral-like aspartic protease family protein [Neiella holothuriorum]